jgi:2-iminobutanoate/2-iminopropanoate deaminase
MKYVESPKAVKPLGPYSQGIEANGLVFVSGTVPIDPATNSMVQGGIREQTKQVLENISAVLESAGSDAGKVTKVNVYLKNGADFKEMNEVYAAFFGDHKPTRTTVVVGFVRDDLLVEIDCVATR